MLPVCYSTAGQKLCSHTGYMYAALGLRVSVLGTSQHLLYHAMHALHLSAAAKGIRDKAVLNGMVTSGEVGSWSATAKVASRGAIQLSSRC